MSVLGDDSRIESYSVLVQIGGILSKPIDR